MVVACLLVVAFLVLLQLPTHRMPGALLVATFVAWLASLGLTMLLQAELPAPDISPDLRRLFPDSTLEVRKNLALPPPHSSVPACHIFLNAGHPLSPYRSENGSVGRQSPVP